MMRQRRRFVLVLSLAIVAVSLCWLQNENDASSSSMRWTWRTNSDKANERGKQEQQQKQIVRQLRQLSWSDPRTTIGKEEPASTTTSVASLRIVAFGTSKTWGAGLDDPKHETYISLLSPTAVNLGLRSTPADYPSLCLHSMIGDQEFDVIILEFSPFGGKPLHDFQRLLRRLQARFPSAILIYLPIYMILMDVTYRNQFLQNHLLALGMKSPNSPEFESTIRNLPNDELHFPCESYEIEEYRTTMNNLDGRGYMLEFPSFETKNVKNFVIDNAKYYTSENRPWDFVHPSILGHQEIANKIRQLLVTQALQAPQRTRTTAVTTQDGNNNAHWLGGKDRCISWFSGGNVTEDVIRYKNMELINFTPDGDDGKWALQVGRSGGTLAVTCTFPKCNIFVSYMAKGPERDYPRVLLSLQSNQQQSPEPILVDPLTDRFHVREIVYLGKVDVPGVATVSVKPTPEDVKTPLGFRITGVITTPATDD